MMRRKMVMVAMLLMSVSLSVVYAPGVQAKYVDAKNVKMTLKIRKPRYTVHFDANANGEEEGEMDDQEFTYGTERALTLNEYTREGYLFVGWNTLADAGDGGHAYRNGQRVQNLDALDGAVIDDEVVTLYAQWEENVMHAVFEINGECVFHGYDMQQNPEAGYITGSGCEVGGVNYADGTHRFIDTGVQLYSQDNYEKDYEIGFTILEYNSNRQYKEPGDNASQASFMNTKLEDESKHFPGLVVRKNSNNIEVTQTINNVRPTPGLHSAATTTKVTVARVDGVVYYAFNDDPFTRLQDINGTSNYFNTTVWFGAAARADGVTPMRFIDAKLTDMYVKMGEKGVNRQTISFDAGGITSNPADITIIGSRKVGSALPVLNDQNGHFFRGWYTEQGGGGVKVTSDTVIESDMTLYAYWRDSDLVCNIGASGYNTLQGCIDAANPSDTITLIDDVKEHVIVNNGKIITIDLGGYTLEHNNGNTQVIKNYGDLTLINGTVTSSLAYGMIDNYSTGRLTVGQGLRAIATGTRQAIYNEGGKVWIIDDAYLSAISSERATLQNNTNGGEIYVEGGTIVSANYQGIYNKAGSLTIGVLDGTINSRMPVIQGATYGIMTTPNITMYDGILRGRTAAINDASKITTIEVGATPVAGTEVIDGATYQTLHYEISAP